MELWQTYKVDGELEGYCCKKTLSFQSKACAFISNGVGSINVQCNVGIFEHIFYQGCRYLLWA